VVVGAHAHAGCFVFVFRPTGRQLAWNVERAPITPPVINCNAGFIHPKFTCPGRKQFSCLHSRKPVCVIPRAACMQCSAVLCYNDPPALSFASCGHVVCVLHHNSCVLPRMQVLLTPPCLPL
jgi:hypothetical protein